MISVVACRVTGCENADITLRVTAVASAPLVIWQRTLNRIAPLKPCDLSRLDLLDGLQDRTETR